MLLYILAYFFQCYLRQGVVAWSIRLAPYQVNNIRWFLGYFTVAEVIQIPTGETGFLSPLQAINGTTLLLNRWCWQAKAEEDGFGSWGGMLLGTEYPPRQIIQTLFQIRIFL